MTKTLLVSLIGIIYIQKISCTDLVIAQLGCTSTATSSTCHFSDAICTSEGYCTGPATCSNTDCSIGPVCPVGEECYQIYRTSTYKCCTWIGSSDSANSTINGSNCLDLAAPGRPSDCPANAHLCQNALYKDLMKRQCPKTCGYCSTSGTVVDQCEDLAASGRPSDCPMNANLCTNPLYQDLMAKQCPKTCGFCSSTNSGGNVRTYINTGFNNDGFSSSIATSGCVDKAVSGRASDCPSLSYLCSDPTYNAIMREQCPKTCGFC